MNFQRKTNSNWPKNKPGFTIVELLVAIVVIAILAAISVVSYNGIQNRASDSAVQADIRNWINTIRMHEAEQGSLPRLGNKIGAQTDSDLVFKASKNAYDTSVTYNMYICKTRDGSNFGIALKSKSGKVYAYKSDEGFIQYSGPIGESGGSASICPAIAGSPFFSQVGYYSRYWTSWTQ